MTKILKTLQFHVHQAEDEGVLTPHFPIRTNVVLWFYYFPISPLVI